MWVPLGGTPNLYHHVPTKYMGYIWGKIWEQTARVTHIYLLKNQEQQSANSTKSFCEIRQQNIPYENPRATNTTTKISTPASKIEPNSNKNRP